MGINYSCKSGINEFNCLNTRGLSGEGKYSIFLEKSTGAKKTHPEIEERFCWLLKFYVLKFYLVFAQEITSTPAPLRNSNMRACVVRTRVLSTGSIRMLGFEYEPRTVRG